MSTERTAAAEPANFERSPDGIGGPVCALDALVGPQCEAALVAALEKAPWFGGLGEALDRAPDHPSPAVVDALWRALQSRSGEVAVHCAALLTHLHGLASEPFDMEQRPFFLGFTTEHRQERQAAIDALRTRIERARP